ncbi:hypothetical protein AGABI1DRAFT_69401 [Agaricus bisporus var. burnettii JB137-S8]|uniref:EGF-like domain-containing protein n=1 Tax=Agaricus bisporus var. burnettii (strain JB137-S8 / ATCC MYA-4627 / FGSC 10392) TaxID=597362 RepID=K5X5P0_AGABU|nr:uncharacterized protein AGABI1DRAFT_69401 [Agaricus bisporus var. burnettii JB137-S8]EKM83166.1 hypothetical protein AGABI1DRAFT_69401 [Agaricus bisporus var. burnettii JB137-S8]
MFCLTVCYSIVGARLTASDTSISLHLLPGTYSSATSPQLLHNLLTSSSASLSPSTGFENASKSFNPTDLPFELELSPGITIYDGLLYSGQSLYGGFPDKPPPDQKSSQKDITLGSLAISQNVFIVIGGSSDSDDRVVVWNSIPDIRQLPSSASLPASSSSSSTATLRIIDVGSSTCNPQCSGNSICSPTTGRCVCAPGFTGTSCESCSPGLFGPTCQACPDGCDQCDEGISGSGICLKKTVTGKPGDCGCVNGQCGSNGQCACNAGWKDGDDGRKCSKCQDGFFLTSTGDCQVCQLGCSRCADTSGTCVQCNAGFAIDTADNTKCNLVRKPTSTGQQCPDGSFSNGDTCAACASDCETCTGATSNDCATCASGRFKLNGNCVTTNSDGTCVGATGMIANNIKSECDACPSKCTSCAYSSFSVASTINQSQCTGCLPGFFLSQGKCVESCPAGTFLSPQDNLNCIPCDSSCGTCIDSADFCLTCSTAGRLASDGKCVSSCPSDTFPSNSTSCGTCHGDCASCSGPQFNQCTSCPPNRPVLKDGRCLSTCAKGEFFDKTSSSCTGCDSNCETCSASGPDKCLSCTSGEVLRSGKCVKTEGGCQTLAGFGVCLEELVITVGQNHTTNATTPAQPKPSISGIADPTVVRVENKLEGWQIALMVLGVVFILCILIILWRWRARRKRKERTQAWAARRKVLGNMPWWKRMFASRWRDRSSRMEKEGRLPQYRDEVSRSTRADSTVDGFIDAYADARSSRSDVGSRSLFSEVTGSRRKAPEPRVPVRSSVSTVATSQKSWRISETEAARYARSIREQPGPAAGEESLSGLPPFLATEPFERNPFRRRT